MKQKVACVRSDLKILVLEVEVDGGGAIHYAPGQREQLDKFHGRKRWEWLYWIIKGTSQGSHGQPLSEPFMSLHHAFIHARRD